jgi:hypothetical protein
MAPVADFALLGPLALLAALALNALLLRRHGAAFWAALAGGGSEASVQAGTPPGEPNVLAFRPVAGLRRPALRAATDPAYRLAA